MSHYVLESLLAKWGTAFETLDRRRRTAEYRVQKNSLFSLCTNLFTRDQLKALIQQQELSTSARVFIYSWKQLGIIEAVDKNTFRKTTRR